jgi:uncharacterized protein RhaS with RHS repeats
VRVPLATDGGSNLFTYPSNAYGRFDSSAFAAGVRDVRAVNSPTISARDIEVSFLKKVIECSMVEGSS